MANRQLFGILGRQIKNFSTSIPKSAGNAAPIQLYGLEGRYAHAIYAAAIKKNQLDSVDKDFQNILNLFKQEKGLNELLKNPLLTKEQRKNAVNELAVKKNANELTVNALSLMADNGRLGRLQGIAKALATIMRAHRGEVSARVTTAKPLDNSQLKELQAVLQTFMKQGHKLQLETKVDPSLIGGMIVELGDRYVDLSISSKFKLYSNIVKETL
jgi:F-type H+-transporting ATPase subunit O